MGSAHPAWDILRLCDGRISAEGQRDFHSRESRKKGWMEKGLGQPGKAPTWTQGATQNLPRLNAPKHPKSAGSGAAVTCSPAGGRCPRRRALTRCTRMGHLRHPGKSYSLGNFILYIKFPISSNTEANQGGRSLWRGAQWPCSAWSHCSFIHSFPSLKQTIFLPIPKVLQGCFPAPTRRSTCCHQSPSQPDSYRGSPPPVPAFQLIECLFTYGLQGGNKSMWEEAPLHGQRLCKQMARGDSGCLLPCACCWA